MRRKTKRIGCTSLAVLLFCGLLGGPGKGRDVVQATDRGDHTSSQQLEGTWSIIVTPPVGGPPPYLAIASFGDGGVLVTSPDPSVGPSPTSSGQGTWERTRMNRFASTHVAFMYGPGGLISGAIKINSSYRLTGSDRFEGRGQLQICDASLNNCLPFPGCSTLQGTRITAEPPSCTQ